MPVLVTEGQALSPQQCVSWYCRRLPQSSTPTNRLMLTMWLRWLQFQEAEFYAFEQHDIRDCDAVNLVIANYAPDAIIQLGAESHVDRSITGSAPFIKTVIVATSALLGAARRYCDRRSIARQIRFRLRTCRLMRRARWAIYGGERPGLPAGQD
ncbi:GDP-mannose 4,6-dehydratase [Bradyrhizobium sp. BR 10261]|uniref:GDP-mannose 4,6-dehydratase n=1 Tax=Bradyrhizobium sp. BR 10261 TaxID=2749992 RepID=UPI001C64778D|nr:GDP-mannose 4,6-dehydratase [Bradyrhizobium sp. BR 10261]